MDISKNLSQFGLNSKETEVYLILMKFNWLTALQISRKCSVNRTTLYRILERLLAKDIIEQKIDDKTTYYSAASADHFERIVLEKERQAKQLRQILPGIKSHFRFLNQIGPLETSVKFYRGIRGLQHLELIKAQAKGGEILIIDSNQWDKVLTREFAEEVRGRIVKNNIQVREVCNISHTGWTDNQEYLKNHYRYRVIPKKVINISQDIHIFGDSIYFCGYNQNDLVGIEIVSQEYSQIMKQIFEVLWKMAKA